LCGAETLVSGYRMPLWAIPNLARSLR